MQYAWDMMNISSMLMIYKRSWGQLMLLVVQVTFIQSSRDVMEAKSKCCRMLSLFLNPKSVKLKNVFMSESDLSFILVQFDT